MLSVIWVLGLVVIFFSGAVLWLTSGLVFMASLFGELKQSLKPTNRTDRWIMFLHGLNAVLFVVGTILLVKYYLF